MRILQLIPNLPVGGAERLMTDLTLGLRDRGNDVAALSMSSPLGSVHEQRLAEAGVRVYYLGKRQGPDPRMYFRIRRVLRALRPDVVHTHRYVLRYAYAAFQACRIPVRVHTLHNLPLKDCGKGLARWLTARAYASGVVPVAIADEVARRLPIDFGIVDAPVIPNGIDVRGYRQDFSARAAWRAREGFDPEDVLLVMVAGFRAQKNHGNMVNAFAQIASRVPWARLVLVGDGPTRPASVKRAEELGLGHRAQFLGLRNDIAHVLAGCDAFVLSSDYEGNPLSVMEAMAAGLPCICTAVGGVPELVVDGVTGRLVPPRDSAALAGAAIEVISSPETMVRMGREAAETALRRFDVTAMVDSYARLYERILAGRAAKAA